MKNADVLDVSDVRALLAIFVAGMAKAGVSQNGVAKRMGISTGHLSRVLRGEKQPGEKVLRFLGLKQVVCYCHNPKGKFGDAATLAAWDRARGRSE